MRIIVVWMTAIFLIFVISLGWYVTLPTVIGVSYALNSTLTHSTGRSISAGIQYVAYAWGPLLCIFILLWAIISSQKRDVESEVYG